MPVAPSTRRSFVLGSSALLAGLFMPTTRSASSAAADALAFNDPAYWAFADRMQDVLDPYWDGRGYKPERAMLNANLLLTHAAAAFTGHTGPSRKDDRARALVDALCNGPSWLSKPRSGTQGHVPGWADGLWGGGIQHLVVDTEIAWALMVAWQAREVIGVDGNLIADRLIKVAGGAFWRWPALRLNQINWYARIYAAAATVGGDGTELHGELLKQLRRFIDGVSKPMAGATVANLAPSYRFHYLPDVSEQHKYNLDSAEYANIVCGFLVAYQQARGLGMPGLDARRAAVVRAWCERVLCGYWTHAGYLNWDTGLGFKRWHQGKKLGLSQAALLGIASCPELAANGAWAKSVLDNSFELFGRWTDRARGVPPANAFDVPSIDDNESSAVLAVARVQANAAQAVLLGLGSMKSVEPPPLYAFDPDVGRLAVTTPTYNTAIVAVSRGAFPYGGLELARFFDGRQDVAGGIGGRPPASFGVVVREGGKIVLASQRAVDAAEPLELVEPKSTSAPWAGSFTRLRVAGKVSKGSLSIRTEHRFESDFVETEWRVSGSGDRRCEVLFPSWGAGARVSAVGADGARRSVAGSVSLDDADWFHVESQYTGYVVKIRRGTGRASLLAVAAQSSAPHPGPTLTVRMDSSTVVARIAPARTAEEARAVAQRL